MTSICIDQDSLLLGGCMNVFFKMCDEILDSKPAQELAQRSERDRFDSTRVLLFIKLLTYALSPSKQFVDAAALAAFSGAPLKQAEKVWEVCRKYGVLRMADYGYTARAWMVENGYLGRSKSDIDKAFEEGIYGKG